MSSRTSLVVEHEIEPAKMTLDQLRQEYVTLKMDVYNYTEKDSEINKKIEALRAKSVNFQLYSETQEESIANRCLRNLDDEKNSAKQWNEEIVRKRCELRTLKQEIADKRKSQSELKKSVEQKKEEKLKQLHEKLVSVNDRHNKLEAELLEKRQCYLSALLQILTNIRTRHEADVLTTNTSSSVITNATNVTDCSARTDADTNNDKSKLTENINKNSSSSDNANTNTSFLFANKVVESLITPISVATNTEDNFLSSPSMQESMHSAEQRINRLIKDHKRCIQKFNEEREEYDELVNMLKKEEQECTLLRVKAAKLEEDLHAEQHKLEDINAGGLANSSFGDSSFCTTPNRSLDPFLVSSMGYSLRERTRELLSTSSPQITTTSATAANTLEHAEQ